MLCAMGGNRGVGFDPAFVPQRRPEEGGDAVEFIQDFYSEKYTHIKADFIACRDDARAHSGYESFCEHGSSRDWR